MSRHIDIDSEFKALIPPLSSEEFTQLEANILADGCRDPLVVWLMPTLLYCEECEKDVLGTRSEPDGWEYSGNGVWDSQFEKFVAGTWEDEVEIYDHGEGWPALFCPECHGFLDQGDIALLDGHNRYEICQQHGVEFSTVDLELPDRQAAINWIINNQLGRRNLHPDQASYLRGKRYNADKEAKGGDRGNQYTVAKDQNDPLPESTADRLATEFKVSAPTIKRDGQYAAAVDSLASVGVDAQSVIAHASKADVIELAKVLEKPEPVIESPLFPEPKPVKPAMVPPVIQRTVDAIKTGAVPVKEIIKESAKDAKIIKQQSIVEPVMTSYITLDDWGKLALSEQQMYLKGIQSGKTYNRQSNDNEESIGNIEWAKWSWNPVSGCKHDCPYCYARDIAARFYDQGFVPTLYPDRLHAPVNTKVPANAATDISYKNVFTCSMADLFGRWVPKEWIEAVLEQVRNNPQWNFLFLTKFPKRLSEFKFPDNAWLGTTVDCQIRVKAAEDAFRKMREEGSGGVWWLSVEPMIEPLQFSSLEMFDWVVIGGSSRSTQTPEWHPPRAWVNALEQQARDAGCKVYEKTNLLSRIRQYPGFDEPEITQAPAEFHYLGKSA